MQSKLSKEEMAFTIRLAVEAVLKRFEEAKIAPVPWNVSQWIAKCVGTIAALEPEEGPVPEPDFDF